MAAVNPGPDERLGRNRTSRLDSGERELYRWILRTFAQTGPPAADEIGAAAESLGVDVDPALTRLADQDLVHRGPNGEITVAYPFSGTPTRHIVRLRDGHCVFAMCAVDALGIPYMLGEAAEIFSQDPVTGDEITVRVNARAGINWSPESAVVSWGATSADGRSADICCGFVDFFASEESAREYLARMPQLVGELLPVPEAARIGDATFGQIFDER